MILETGSVDEMSSQAPGSMASFAFGNDTEIKPIREVVDTVVEEPYAEEVETPNKRTSLDQKLS